MSDFWDALAPFHAAIEDNYFDLQSLKSIIDEVVEPVLVVGAGQGLIVEALIQRGLLVDGIDFSEEMIRYAAIRRKVSLIRADARSLPFGDSSYNTIIFATGVVDFIDDDAAIQAMLHETRRVLKPSGKVFLAFYRISDALLSFLGKLGLRQGNLLAFREVMAMHRMTPWQTIGWTARRANLSYFNTLRLLFRSWYHSTAKEQLAATCMQSIFKKHPEAESLIDSAPLYQPYRNEDEIRNLFVRLSFPIASIEATESCFIATFAKP